jgi:hypothetical protein
MSDPTSTLIPRHLHPASPTDVLPNADIVSRSEGERRVLVAVTAFGTASIQAQHVVAITQFHDAGAVLDALALRNPRGSRQPQFCVGGN